MRLLAIAVHFAYRDFICGSSAQKGDGIEHDPVLLRKCTFFPLAKHLQMHLEAEDLQVLAQRASEPCEKTNNTTQHTGVEKEPCGSTHRKAS